METGAFAMFDALGIKGIREDHDPDAVVRKFEELAAAARRIVDREFGGPGHPNTENPHNFVKMIRMGFVSDTVVIGFVNKERKYPPFAVMMAARYAGEVVRLGLRLAPPWAYRGVVTYGDFAIHESGSFFVGPAVDEAAGCFERADAALIWLGKSARRVLEDATESDFQGAVTRGEYDVPIKPKCARCDPPTSYRTHVASPFPLGSTPDEAADIAATLLATFDTAKDGVSEKLRNTEAFLQQHLQEHRAIWDANQALYRKVFDH